MSPVLNSSKNARVASTTVRGMCLLISAALAVISCGDAGKTGSGPTNELLIVGYDREPDTMNRYATHILEDIESCVVEGLVTNDEKMQIVPVLAREIPTVENGGVVLRPRRRHGCHLEVARRGQVA